LARPSGHSPPVQPKARVLSVDLVGNLKTAGAIAPFHINWSASPSR
jgi:hypothetical protein